MLLTGFFYMCFVFALNDSDVITANNPTIQTPYQQFLAGEEGTITLDQGDWFYYRIHQREQRGATEIVRGMVEDDSDDHQLQAINFTVVLDHQQQTARGMLSLRRGIFELNSRAATPLIWHGADEPPVCVLPEQAPELLHDHGADMRSQQKKIGEKDLSGRYVIDVFMGFSDQAAAHVGDIQAESLMLVETVNTGLRNSGVDGVYLRLVGVGTSPENPGVITSTLDDGKRWFADEIETYQPDLIGLVQMPTGADGSAGGWAPVGGDISVIGAPWPSAFRHEVGHNAGGIHCKGANDSGYHFGYSPEPGLGTIQCGNNMSYYSTPLIRDPQGRILGTDHANDMARVWRERMAAMSARRIHTVPFPGETEFPLLIEAEDYREFSDTTYGNQGGAYRSDDVDIEATTDQGGGFNVGWIRDGEWLAYEVTLPAAATYRIDYRVAALEAGGSIQLEQQGGDPVFGEIAVPATGGWQNWVTVSHEVALPAGTQQIALLFKGGNFNVNRLSIHAPEAPPTLNRLQSRWYPDRYIHIENGEPECSAAQPGWWSAQWYFEAVEGGRWYRLRNRWRGQLLYLNGQDLALGDLDDNDQEAHWFVETDGDHVRFGNRANRELFLNIQNQTLQVSPIAPGWWSAQWRLEELQGVSTKQRPSED